MAKINSEIAEAVANTHRRAMAAAAVVKALDSVTGLTAEEARTTLMSMAMGTYAAEVMARTEK